MNDKARGGYGPKRQKGGKRGGRGLVQTSKVKFRGATTLTVPQTHRQPCTKESSVMEGVKLSSNSVTPSQKSKSTPPFGVLRAEKGIAPPPP